MSRSKILASKKLFQSNWLVVRRDEITKPDGTLATYEVVERGNGVVVIGMHQKKMFFVKQYRYAIDSDSLELPGGFIQKDEKAEDAAIREFSEETGYKPNRVKFLDTIWTSAGLLTQTMSVFLVEDCTQENQQLDATEQDMQCKLLSIEEIKLRIAQGEIKNSMSLAALYLYFNSGIHSSL